MSKALRFIKKSNQVLFFCAAILFIALLSLELYSSVTRDTYEPPKIEIVDSSDPDQDVKKPIYTLDYLTELKDVHIFELTAKVIDTSEYRKTNVVNMFSGAKISHDLSSGMYFSGEAINLMFVKEGGEQAMLLRKDGLIKAFRKARFDTDNRNHALSLNLYLITERDTNNNGYLDENDSATLYSSSYDGKQLSAILVDVGSFKLVGDNKLILSQAGASPSFYTFDLIQSKLVKLNTALEAVKK